MRAVFGRGAREKPVDNIVVVSGLLIGLAYGAVALLSGFCLLSGLRGWWADGDSRLIRTYALALGVAIAAGLAVGLLVTSGWFATGYLGADDFNPAAVTSLTFIAPIADSVQYVMLSTGLTLNFGIAMVAGVFAGSLLTALITRRFQWEGFSSPRHMLRSIGGAALMGAGGAMAYGCSIGQGLTGLSTLALASFVAVGGILLGTAAGLRGVLRVQPPVPAQESRPRA